MRVAVGCRPHACSLIETSATRERRGLETCQNIVSASVVAARSFLVSGHGVVTLSRLAQCGWRSVRPCDRWQKAKLHSQGPLLEPPREQAMQTNDTKTKLHSQGPLLEPPCVQTTQTSNVAFPRSTFGTSLCASDTDDSKTKLHSQGPLSLRADDTNKQSCIPKCKSVQTNKVPCFDYALSVSVRR